jgi:hypothetical protein
MLVSPHSVRADGGSSIVQQNSVFVSESANPAITFTSSVTSGNVVVVAIDVEESTSNIVTSVTDTLGTSFTEPAASPSILSQAAGVAYIYYGTAASTGSDTITVHMSVVNEDDIFVYEVAGITTVGATAVAGTSGSETRTASESTSPAAFTTEGFLLMTSETDLTDTCTAGAGFTCATEPIGDSFGLTEYSTTGVSSPTSFPMTLNQADWWDAVGIAFNASGASSSPLVQQASGGCTFCESHTSTASFSQEVTAGDLIVVGASTSFEPIDPVPLFTVNDTLGSTYTQAVAYCYEVAQDSCAAIYYATAPSSGGEVTVTVTLNAPADPQSLDIFIYELTGVTTAGAATATGQGESYIPLSPVMMAPVMADGLPNTAVSTSPASFTNQAFLLGVVNAVQFEDPPISLTPGAGFTASVPSSGSGRGFAQYSVSGVTSPTTFPGTLDSIGLYWVEVGLALNYPQPSTGVSCPSVTGGVAVPAGATFTDYYGRTWTVPGGSTYTYFFAGPQSNIPPPLQQGFGGEYVTYNGQQGWIISFSCSGSPSGTSTTGTSSSSGTGSTTSCPTTPFADSVAFTAASATWSSSGSGQSVSVPLTNCWTSTLPLTIYATLNSGSTTYVLVGQATAASGQTVMVTCQVPFALVPHGEYTVTFAAVTGANVAVSAPSAPIFLIV